MRRFAFGLAMVTLLPPIAVQAQLMGTPLAERARWELEASALAHYETMDFGQVNQQIRAAPAHFAEQSIYSGYHDVNEIKDGVSFDFRFGTRAYNFHFGAEYNSAHRREGGYTLQHVSYGEIPYKIELNLREYSVYAGYMHPVKDWLEVGPIIAVGMATIKGTLTDADAGAEGAEVTGSYTPIRAELRSRARLTRYISIDLEFGIRSGTSTDVEADYGISGIYGLPDSKGPVQDYESNPMEINTGGWYAGGGITLLNPFLEE